MPLPDAALLIRPWATDGDRTAPEDRSPALDRANGWPLDWSRAGGETPAREVLNQLVFELSSLLAYVRDHGALAEWHAMVVYVHPAYTTGSNGVIYRSVQGSTNVNPTTDTDLSHWRPLVLPIDIHNQVTQSATPADSDRFPFSDESETGDPTRYVTGANLKAYIAPNATTTRRGIVEMATSAEAQAGTDTSRAVTPAGARAAVEVGNAGSVDGIHFWRGTTEDLPSSRSSGTIYFERAS